MLNFDKQHIWHPYTSSTGGDVWPVVDAQGVRLTLADGRQLIDGMASWWSVIHGYRNPVMDEALKAQIDKFSHVMFGGLTHQPAVDLARTLVGITPAGLEHVFFADSGSVSVDVAMKMALQYWMGQGKPHKHRFMSPRFGYHGDTIGSMSLCDPEGGMHGLFSGVLAKQIFVDAPNQAHESDDGSDIQALEHAFKQHHNELAAFTIEPIVQGAGGMRIYRPAYLQRVAELCEEFDVLLVVDEIATGFGRTGTLFACEQAEVSPDIMCVGKALTGGYMTLAATLATSRVAQGIDASESGVLMHGPTFMGNPLACAAANASLGLLLNSDWRGNIQRIQNGLERGLAHCRDLDGVANVRIKGAIGVVQITDPSRTKQIQRDLVDAGVWLRPFRDLIYTMPPYVTSDDDLETLTEVIHKVLRQ
ncbi:MAG: adenosylmethionine-8-amino-7-oxononanoate aminotransferase [Gammaproteobacteria bacterium]|jgi:adenosylmethionine-8-amino-7-oxononanoate aminotransferase